MMRALETTAGIVLITMLVGFPLWGLINALRGPKS